MFFFPSFSGYCSRSFPHTQLNILHFLWFNFYPINFHPFHSCQYCIPNFEMTSFRLLLLEGGAGRGGGWTVSLPKECLTRCVCGARKTHSNKALPNITTSVSNIRNNAISRLSTFFESSSGGRKSKIESEFGGGKILT